MTMDGHAKYVQYSAMVVAIIGISFASIFIRWSDAPPLALLAYRLLFASIILFPFVYQRSGQEIRSLRFRQTALMMIIGVVLALHFLTFMLAVNSTSVTSATVLVSCHPLIVGLVGAIWLRERSRFIEVGILLSFAGIVIISLGDYGVHDLGGDMLALLGGILYAVYLISGRIIRQGISLLTYVFILYLTASATCFIAALATSTPLWPYPWQEFAIALGLALLPTIFGHTILNWLLRYLHAAIVSLSALGEPLGASILAFFILSEVPSAWEVVGGALVLLGIFLVIVMDIRSRPAGGS